ncbi:MAG: acyl-ACP thioesterase [Verrucomicrobiales bacterium]
MGEEPRIKVISPGGAELVDAPTSGRTFTSHRRVSIDDSAPDGRMELDAIARFLQDVGNDDTDDAGMAELGLAWVARRATIETRTPARARECLELTTWCSGIGRRWAERRTSIRGELGAHIEAAAVWVHLDAETGRPIPWGDDFSALYLEATNGRLIDAKLRHDKTVPDGASESPWTFRSTDMDAFGHVNNAAYLSIAEEHLDLGTFDRPQHIEIEWRAPSLANEDLCISTAGSHLWVTATATNEVRATITS